MSQISVIQEIENLKNQVEALKPFPNDIEKKILQKFRLDWNFHSNAIEGNPYTYGETLTFIMHGITAKGKTMKDHFDVKGHNEGINFILSLVKDERSITESDIRALHKLILVEPYEVDTVTPSGLSSKKMILIGNYKKEPNHVKTKTGEIHYYASPEDTPFLMQELLKWYSQCVQNKEIHPLVTTALFHHKLTEIHPFDDGNGRMARLLMNLILLKAGFPPVVVRNEDKNNYYEALSLADAGEKRHIVEYLGNLLVHSLNIYIKGAKGENIEDESDIDKEIALFKAGFEKEDYYNKSKNGKVLEELFNTFIFKFIEDLIKYSNNFSDLFIETNYSILFTIDDEDEKNYLNLNSIKVDQKYYFEEINELNKIQITFFFMGFKKSKNPFTIELCVELLFSKYYFIIYIRGFSEFQFKYNEISNNQYNEIMKSFTGSIIKIINSNKS
ncbi:MAG: Fic family protein [Cytophagales bacterium]|nr:MAG: Fic family protein [Cytophagales bacterium]